MESRLRGHRDGPTVVYDSEIPPHPFTCNRAAHRQFSKSGRDHTKIEMKQLTTAGKDLDGKTIYFMGEERFTPPYIWKRVKAKKAKGKNA